jgi:hypothetical protein
MAFNDCCITNDQTISSIKIRLLTELKYKNQALNVMEFCKNLTCKTESRRD